MSTHAAPSPERPKHEGSDLRPGVVLLAASGVIAMVLVVALIATLLARSFHPLPPGASTLQSPPSPAVPLRSDPVEEQAAFQREKRSRLESYGWVDARHQSAHVPIERAMEMLARKDPAHGSSDRTVSKGIPTGDGLAHAPAAAPAGPDI